MGSEFGYFTESIDQHTMVIAISQSGETADVIEGVKKARGKGATILSLVNVMESTLARLSDQVLYLNCGPEIGVAATKSFIAQLSLLYLLSYATANRYEEGINQLLSISQMMEANLQTNGSELAKLANDLSDKKDFYYIARGINFAVAGEGSLKLKEIAYVHAEGMPAGELKHGTLALIEKDTPVIVICPDDYTYAETMANAAESKARGAYIVSISDREDTSCDKYIQIPTVGEVIDKQDYEAFVWITHNISDEYETAILDPWKATAFTAITGKYVFTRIHSYPKPSDEKATAFLKEGCLDTSFLRENDISIVYTRSSCNNPDLAEIRENIYILK